MSKKKPESFKLLWREGARRATDVQVVFDELRTIEKRTGGLEPPEIVEVARNPDSVLHGEFEWDDRAAAERWRIRQARSLVQEIVFIPLAPDGTPKKNLREPIRAFFTVHEGERQFYQFTFTVAAEPDKREQVAARLRQEIRRWRLRAKEFDEFAKIVAAVDTMAA